MCTQDGPASKPVIDTDYGPDEAEDEYDRQCVDAALAEPDAGEFISLDDVLVMYGYTRADLKKISGE